jgi:predicted membrane channel-forming protein YqfA (hemolysin III family)
MGKPDNIPDIGWEEVVKKFIELVLKSPTAIITLVLSFFLGYSISFIIFDYRNNKAKGSHFWFHLFIGLGYSALMFLILNWKKINLEMTEEDFSKVMPITILVSFAIAFIAIVTISIIREIKRPYANA